MTTAALTTSSPSRLPLYFLALGTFAIGTEGFMIAPLLPDLAADLSVSVMAAGQLVTIFALTYALSSPVLTTLTAGFDRRHLLIGAMTGFALANVIAYSAQNYWMLMAARVLLAIAAGLYVPSANALAGTLLKPEHRGSALAVVNAGTTIAIALGVPLGAIVGDHFGWRLTFAGVGTMALIATIGLVTGLPRDIGGAPAAVSLSARIAVVKQPRVLPTVLVTTLFAMGGYTLYIYLALYLTMATTLRGFGISAVLFTWGSSAAIGTFAGGMLADRFGSRRVIAGGLAMFAAALIALSLIAIAVPPAFATIPVFIVIGLWGFAGWSFFTAQISHLISIASAKFAAIVLSLNSSFLYLGFSLGAVTGSLTLARGTPADLGLVGGLLTLTGLALSLWTGRQPKPATPVVSDAMACRS